MAMIAPTILPLSFATNEYPNLIVVAMSYLPVTSFSCQTLSSNARIAALSATLALAMVIGMRDSALKEFLYLTISFQAMRITLKVVEEKVNRCRLCPLYKTAHKGVAGEGPKDARIFFVGQAPGAQEDKTGRPFVGRAGTFLTEQLNAIGIDREDVFITSVVKHFPPGNRMPTKGEVNACLPYLLEQIAQVNPKIVVLMGNLAQSIKGQPVLQGRKILETPHPAAAMRFPKLRKVFNAKIATLKYIR